MDPQRATNSKNQPLLDPQFMRRLEQLQIVSHKIFAGKFKGERLSRARGRARSSPTTRTTPSATTCGSSTGRIYARLDKLFIKLFREEEDLDVTLLVDCSTSMDWGEPNKFWYGRRLAAAMGYIALGNFDRVNLYGLTDRVNASATGLRGRSQMHRILGFLQDLKPLGAATWARHAGASRSSTGARAW